jgi:hypothetical protein
VVDAILVYFCRMFFIPCVAETSIKFDSLQIYITTMDYLFFIKFDRVCQDDSCSCFSL